MKNRMSSFCMFGLMIVLPFRASAQETKLLATLKGHNECVLSLAISPDSRTLVSGGFDKTIKVWDIPTGNEKETLRGHTNHVNSLAFSPDGTTVASGGDTTISLWKLSKAGERTILKVTKSRVFRRLQPRRKVVGVRW